MLFLIACIHILYVTLSLALCEIAVRIAAHPSASAPCSALVLGIHCSICRGVTDGSFMCWVEP
jgi:hypothetical protein